MDSKNAMSEEMKAHRRRAFAPDEVAAIEREHLGRVGFVTFATQEEAETYLRLLPEGYSGQTAKREGGGWSVTYRLKDDSEWVRKQAALEDGANCCIGHPFKVPEDTQLSEPWHETQERLTDRK